MQFQHTVKSPITFEGTGVHTAQKVQLNVLPAKEKFGIRFKRTDLENQPEVKAIADNVSSTLRSTTIEKGAAKVQTIEHLMAAFYALGVDNALVEINGAEVPIFDGSAIEFVKKIKEVGLKKQSAERQVFNLDENITFTSEDGKAEIIAMPFDGFKVNVQIQHPYKGINNQAAAIASLNEFEENIAPARTFCVLSELLSLLDNNMAKGGTKNSAVVYVDAIPEAEQLSNLQKHFELDADKLVENEVIYGQELRFTNESARHKLLDFLGDLALCGHRINARFFANCPGHAVNTAFAKHIKEYIGKKKHLLDIPAIDLTAEPLFDIHKIASMLPHRYPFLLLDKIVKLTEDEVIGVKNMTFNEEFFQGHFPDNAIMPGVLQIEAMAQTGGILALSTVEDPQNYWTFFLRIDQAKFKRPVRPGDTAIFVLKLLKPIRRGMAEMKAQTFVGNQLTTEAILTAQIVRKS